MARQKRGSKLLAVLQKRIAGLKSIDENLDLGGGLGIASLTKAHRTLADALDRYNTLLSDVDAALNEVVAAEQAARDMIERTLAGVAAKFGKDSSEYEQAGGTRKSERKKRGKVKAGGQGAESRSAQSDAA